MASEEKPNILWIIAEDMGSELGCYGTPEVLTPVLDRLAARGVRYHNAFTVTFDLDSWDDLKQHQPFFAQLNFSESHREKAWNQAHENIEKLADPGKVDIPPYYPNHPVTRAVWAQYLNNVMAVDKKAGYILGLLRRDGLEINTQETFDESLQNRPSDWYRTDEALGPYRKNPYHKSLVK